MNTLSTYNPFRTSGWDPFRDLGDVENRLARWLGRPATTTNGGSTENLAITEWAPPVDIAEDDKEYLVKAELTDLKKEDVKVTVEDGELTISGERKFEKEEKNKKYHRIERSYGSFTRSFTLPEMINTEKVNAEFKDGLLTVHLPKDEKARPKSIAVKVS